MRRLLLISGLVCGLLAICAIIIGVFLHAPAANSLRAQVAATLLSDIVNDPVLVTGEVTIGIGRMMRVDVEGVDVDQRGRTGDDDLVPVGAVRLEFPLNRALTGRFELSALEVSNITVDIEPGADEREETRPIEFLIGAALSSPTLNNLTLRDILIERRNDPNGWNGTLEIASARTLLSEDGSSISVEASGEMLGEAVTLTGHLPRSGRNADFELTLDMEPVATTLKGDLDLESDVPVLDAAFDAGTPSVGDLLELIGLKRSTDGPASVSTRLTGSLEALAASDIDARFVVDTGGVEVTADGAVADIWAGIGLDLNASAAFPGKSDKAGFDLGLESLKGTLSGDLGAIKIGDLEIRTGLAAVEVTTIGPIDIGRIARSEDGRLELLDITLMQGDADDPHLNLQGETRDLFGLADISLKGGFNLDFASLVMDRNFGSLGRLRGDLALSGNADTLGLDALDAKLAGTDLMTASMTRAVNGDAHSIAIRIDAPDIGAVAAATGGDGRAGGAVSIDGNLSLVASGVRWQGPVTLGPTLLQTNLQVRTPETGPEVVGEISSRALSLASFADARSLVQAFGRADDERVSLTDGAKSAFKAAVDITADSIEGGGEQASSLVARTTFDNQVLKISPLSASYLGGAFDASVSADLSGKVPAIALDAKMNKLSLTEIFDAFSITPHVSGALDADVSLNVAGSGVDAFRKSVSGKISASIKNGVLSSNVVDLAGQNVTDWMFTRDGDGTAPLLCFVSDFDLKEGVGTARTLIFETGKVRVEGAGTVDIGKERVSMVFQPQAKDSALVGSIGPVKLNGPLAKPEITLTKGAVAQKVIGGVLTAPLAIIGNILGGEDKASPEYIPCAPVAPPQ